MEQIIGRISFGNTRAGKAIDVLKEEIIDRHMWEEESRKKDGEIEFLREQVNKLQGIVDKCGIKSQRKILKEFGHGRKK